MIAAAESRWTDLALLDIFPGRPGRCDAVRALTGLDDVVYFEGHRGLVPLGDQVADLHLDVDGRLRLRAPLDLPPSPADALRQSHHLPGNLRYCRDRLGDALVADTRIDGAVHLPQTLRALRLGMLRELSGKAGDDSAAPPSIERAVLQESLSRLPWEDGLVELEQAWELRPRLRGEAVAVRLEIEPHGVRLSREVVRLQPPPPDAALVALATQALLTNARLCHVRLAWGEAGLVAETRLEPWQMEPDWLVTGACAVAVAARHAAAPLRLLAERPGIAETFIRMFCPTGGQPASEDAGG
jgi:hypothetical protein